MLHLVVLCYECFLLFNLLYLKPFCFLFYFWVQLHEAIAREESEEFDEGIVSQEFRRGFLLGERLLRPAMVKVSSGPGKSKSTETTEASTEQSAESVSSEEQPAAAAAVDER